MYDKKLYWRQLLMMPTGNGDFDEKNMWILTTRNGEGGDE